MAPSKGIKRKPTRLVKLDNATAAAQRLTNANAAQSQLLNLNPELRSAIYGHVLGGYDIHIGTRDAGGPIVHSICVATESATALADGVLDMPRSSWDKSALHPNCLISAEGYVLDRDENCKQVSLDLNLLRVCKQIHQEAALLPHIRNTFMVSRAPDLARFSDRLIASQRWAVTSVNLNVTDLAFGSFFEVRKTDKGRLARLKGLKAITLVVDVHIGSEDLIFRPEVGKLPELRLSAEIRNRVYALVLGGNGMHVYVKWHGYGSYDVELSLCTASDEIASAHDHTPAEEISNSITPQDRYENPKLYATCHGSRECHRPLGPTRLDLSLLRVSKQIHQEAALLPFTLNTFVFTQLPGIGCFANRLLLAQKAAVTHLELRTDISGYYTSKEDRARITMLRGLRSLTYTLKERTQYDSDTKLRCVRNSLDAATQVFGSLALTTVDVSVRAFRNHANRVLTEVPIPEEYRTLAREVEEALRTSNAQNVAS